MKTKYFIIAFAVLLYSNITVSQNYFPLAVGNKWIFEANDWNALGQGSRDTLLIEVISDTLMPNGTKYYRLTSNYYFKDYLRADSIGVYCYDTLNNKEWLFYKFGIEEDTIGYPDGSYVSVGYMMPETDTNLYNKIYKFFDGKRLVFGDNVRVISYYYDTGLDNSYSVSISPKYGLFAAGYKGMSSNYDLRLIGCQLSGTTYGTVTSVNKNEVIPSNMTLAQNYPNPFNPGTVIGYEVFKGGKVKLTVYDMLGREISGLVNKYQYPGRYKTYFNADKLASGIYIYRLEQNNNIISRRMVLIK